MSSENEFDEIDNLMFEYFSKNNEVPESTKKVVCNAFNNNKYTINSLKKVAIYIISAAIITSSVALADGLINTENNLFVNTTDAIKVAVENGYVQSVDMDYVYDNNIGIKVNNLVLDDKTADVSFEYKCDRNYSSVILDDCILKTDNFVISENIEEAYECMPIKGERRYKKARKVGENTFNESIIYDLDDRCNNFNKIYFEIKSIIVKEGEVYKTINGNWKFEVDLDDKMINRQSEIYQVSENESIENISVKLMELTLVVDITLNENVDSSFVSGKSGIILKDKNNKEYRYRTVSSGNEVSNNKEQGKIYVEYDISKFQENLEELELYIKVNKDKEINLKLKK